MATITTLDDLSNMVDDYMRGTEFTFDVETMGEHSLNPLLASPIWLSLANADRFDTIPMGHPNGDLKREWLKPNKKGEDRMARGVAYEDLNPKYDLTVKYEREFFPPPEQLAVEDVIPVITPMFETFGILKIGHNIKYDIHVMDKFFDKGLQGPYFDTMIGAWILDSRRVKGARVGVPDLTLKSCVYEELGVEMEKGIGSDISQHTFADVDEYSGLDAKLTHELSLALRARLGSRRRDEWLMSLEMNVLDSVLDMERSGVRIDTEVLRDVHENLEVEVRDIEERMFKAARRKFNPRSNRDKQEVLFLPKAEGGQGIRSAKLTPSGRDENNIYHLAVDNEVLESHRRNPLAALLLLHSAKVKLHGTYVAPYLGLPPIGGVTPKDSQLRDGRVYGQFKQNGTESGRFSSSNPNLQNIPSRTPEGRRIREAFLPNEDHLLVVADYSQIEPRIIASLSEDPTMVDTYIDGGDVYQTVADRMAVTRQAGKTLVLAIAYGVGPRKIAADIGCSMKEARELMDYFQSQFPRIARHKNSVVRDAYRKRYSETIFGRRRFLPEIRSVDAGEQASAKRQAYNHLIQGSAADILKIALVNVHSVLPEGAVMLMTVHDEIVVSSPKDLVEETVDVVRSEMEAARPRMISVPLVAEVKFGNNWAECK